MYNQFMIYTREGDTGNTKLYGGIVVSKYSPVVEFIGLIDELSSIIGLCVSSLEDVEDGQFSFDEEVEVLLEIQRDFHKIGAIVSGYGSEFNTIFEVSNIEETINDYEKLLKPLKKFILPGGSVPSSYLHLARTKTRQVERSAVAMNSKSLMQILPYLNRLSDLLFVMARYVNKTMDYDERTV